MKLEAVPSPNNTNFEKLYMVKLPRGVDSKRVQLALDSALKRRADDRYDRRRAGDDDRRHGHDEEERDLYELRRKLEHVLSQNLSDEAYSAALDVLDEHLPGGQVYGDESKEVAQREQRHPEGEERHFRKYPDRHLLKRLEGEAEGEDELELAERSAESIAGHDRRRRGTRDRVLAHDSADWFTELVGRIKPAISFR
jgi:hypothetical protein